MKSPSECCKFRAMDAKLEVHKSDRTVAFTDE